MHKAFGLLEVLGLPAAIDIADTLCKSGNVRLVRFAHADAGLVTVVIQGQVADVQTAIAVGLNTLTSAADGQVISHQVIPCLDDSVEVEIAIARNLPLAASKSPAPETYLD